MVDLVSDPRQQGRNDAEAGLAKDGANRIFDENLTAKGGDNIAPTAAEIAEYDAGYDEIVNA